MNDDCLKLTTYFGERHRTADGLLADSLLALYGRQELEVSVLLRGVEGFGLRHHLRTDRLLSLSEDLPLVSVAVDTRERVEAVLPAVLALQRRGLVTLERARMIGGRDLPDSLPDAPGEATKLTIYLGRRERAVRAPAFLPVCSLLHRRGVAGASVLLGVDGTVRGQRRRARFLGANAGVPLMVVAVGSGELIARVLPELAALLEHPLLTCERVRICKRDGALLARPPAISDADELGMAMWQKLMVYTSESATHERTPVHVALVRRLREAGAAGATVVRGIWGFHGEHAPHGDRLLQGRRHVPVVTVVIDSPARIARWFEIVDELTGASGLVTSELVPALAASTEEHRRGGLRLARRRG